MSSMAYTQDQARHIEQPLDPPEKPSIKCSHHLCDNSADVCINGTYHCLPCLDDDYRALTDEAKAELWGGELINPYEIEGDRL